MSVVDWLVMALVASFIACKLHSAAGQMTPRDIVFGLTCAVIGGGFLSGIVGDVPVISFNTYSLIIAAIGASVVMWIGHIVAGRRKP